MQGGIELATPGRSSQPIDNKPACFLLQFPYSYRFIGHNDPIHTTIPPRMYVEKPRWSDGVQWILLLRSDSQSCDPDKLRLHRTPRFSFLGLTPEWNNQGLSLPAPHPSRILFLYSNPKKICRHCQTRTNCPYLKTDKGTFAKLRTLTVWTTLKGTRLMATLEKT